MAEETTTLNPKQLLLGLNLDSTLSQIKPGQWTYSLNSVIEGFDGNSITIQNEQGNVFCFDFPSGYKVVGAGNIIQLGKTIFLLTNPVTGDSEVGFGMNDTCIYTTLISDVGNSCKFGFNINYPVHKFVVKTTNCSTQVYFTDEYNPRRYIDLDDLPWKEIIDPSNPYKRIKLVGQLDCNKLNVQPDFNIPQIEGIEITIGGALTTGVYQGVIQYANSLGEGLTAFYNATNPIGIFEQKESADFNLPTAKAITFNVSNLDLTGLYEYFNLAVIKTINNIVTVDLIGTFPISNSNYTYTYTGTTKTDVKINIDDIFLKFPYYDRAGDIFTVDNVLGWGILKEMEEPNFQPFWSQIKLYWESYKLPYNQFEAYNNGINTEKYRSQMRDEVYPYEGVIVWKNGKQTKSYHIPGREATPFDLSIVDANNEDNGFSTINQCESPIPKAYWQVYNTADVINTIPSTDNCYIGPYQYGNMSYWESIEKYPGNTLIWGSLAGKSIRHHKFPDVLVSPIHDNNTLNDPSFEHSIFPIGVKIDVPSLLTALTNSGLTAAQIDQIAGFKIVRGNRVNNKSIIAKGLIHNVGVTTYDSKDYFYPNYPFNDLRIDPYYSTVKLEDHSVRYTNWVVAHVPQPFPSTVIPQTNGNFLLPPGVVVLANGSVVFPSTPPVIYPIGTIYLPIGSYLNPFGNVYYPPTGLPNEVPQLVAVTVPGGILTLPSSTLNGFDPLNNVSKNHFVFHSPDTHFYQPSIDNIGEFLKLETIEYGKAIGHFVKVDDNAEYKFLTPRTVNAAAGMGIAAGVVIGAGMFGWPEYRLDSAVPVYSSTIELFEKLSPYINFGYNFNSVGNYNNSIGVQNAGFKQRAITFNKYVIDGLNGVENGKVLNNFRRESSIYVVTGRNLLFPHEYSGVIPPDDSRYNLASLPDDGLTPETIRTRNICSYYGSIKRDISNQWGHIYSYETIDTGFYQELRDRNGDFILEYPTVFGGDTFINRFAYKSKMPFFRDNTVSLPNQTDIAYDEIGNLNYPMFWISTKAQRYDIDLDSEIENVRQEFLAPSFFDIIANIVGGGARGSQRAQQLLGKLFKEIHDKLGEKNVNMDRAASDKLFEEGLFYMFSYGIPYFFCESEVNVDYRQATNQREGDFYPNVGGDIPDDWLQEKNVPIIQDNKYTYNKTYSKQNKENFFSHLREDYDPTKICNTEFPNRGIWSEQSTLEETKNNWLVYKPVSRLDFPKSYGDLVALDGIESKQVLVRFVNKTLLYNALYTAPTSAGQVYLGRPLFDTSTPPLDYAETDLGYIGSQHKFLLKTEHGHITVDALRGQVFLLQGSNRKELTNENVSKFFTEYLPFEIQRIFPDFPVDNHFNGCGLHGVYDPKYDRFIMTKIDYKPLISNMTYSNGIFMVGDKVITLGDPLYFCNYSFTISYCFNIESWIGFHTYIPNYYIGNNNFFYSGKQNGIWKHDTSFTLYNNFYGILEPYVIEYPYSYKYLDEILQSVQDYSKVLQYDNWQSYIETDDFYFNKCIIYSNQQCSGVLELDERPKNNLFLQKSYPKYNLESKTILYTKSDSFYQFNTFWDLIKDHKKPIWLPSCESLSVFKELNQANMSYGKRSFNKAPIRSKDLKIRLINDKYDEVKFISQFTVTQTQKSFK